MCDKKTICGIDDECENCPLKDTCKGCSATCGQPFGSECIVAKCCLNNGYENCQDCSDSSCGLRKRLICEFNALGIEDMPEITSLNALKGSFVNIEYTLPSGKTIKFWNDNRIYLGNQIGKKNSDRCYGLTADENHLLVCEYSENGTDAEIIVYKKR